MGTQNLQLYQPGNFIPSIENCFVCGADNEWNEDATLYFYEGNTAEPTLSAPLTHEDTDSCLNAANAELNAIGGCSANLEPSYNVLTGDCYCPLLQKDCPDNMAFDQPTCRCKCAPPNGGCVAGTFWDVQDCACKACEDFSFTVTVNDVKEVVSCGGPDWVLGSSCGYCTDAADKVGFYPDECRCAWDPSFEQEQTVICPYANNAISNKCDNSCYQGQADCNALTAANQATNGDEAYYVFSPFTCSCELIVPPPSCPIGYRAEHGVTEPTPKKCLIKPTGTSLSGVNNDNSAQRCSSESSSDDFGLA